jgi:dihydroflavonol-4-reductase
MQGPMLGAPRTGTTEVVRRPLAGQVPAVPNVGWNVVDVRDIAELHILAMTSPAAAGQRFLSSGNFIWYRDIARLLRERLPDAAGKVRTRAMPDLAVKLLARRSPQMAMTRHELGRKRLEKRNHRAVDLRLAG